jgi:hypothetical protein
MRGVRAERDRDVEKDLFNLPVGDSMLGPVLSDVSIVPIASFPLRRVEPDHMAMYIVGVYVWSKADTSRHALKARRVVMGVRAKGAFLPPATRAHFRDASRNPG